VSSEQVESRDAAEAPQPQPKSRRGLSSKWFTLIGAVVIFNIAALILVPPFPKGGAPGDSCAFPACYINGTVEFPAPHVVWPLTDAVQSTDLLTWYPSISSTILTMWIVIAIVLVASILMARPRRMIPGRFQNLFEYFYEFLSDFGIGIAGPTARPYVPIFAAYFLLILFSNWIGLIPPVGRIDELRAPTSDVNITIGLALVAWVIFEGEGFRKLGFRGYVGKFLPIYEFKKGIGAGLIAMFVGLVELMLEFVKPVTLSMRLFGNIYGGEVALGVLTALTLAFVPVGMLGLEVLLNAIQALIFSILTLMFIVLAIESHDHEEGQVADEALEAVHGMEPSPQPAR
jgi:F-type H+-transporting ATPase subunit a